jgi:sulfur relay (sulfurtransferase) complex TusBCD TusD component (DsrE family)
MADKIGIIITKTPHGSEDPENALIIGKEALASGKNLGIFLVSDGVWIGKDGKSDKIQDLLLNIIDKGGKVAVSGPHLKAYGMAKEKLINGIEVVEKPYGELVDLVMEKWDKVIVF